MIRKERARVSVGSKAQDGQIQEYNDRSVAAAAAAERLDESCVVVDGNGMGRILRQERFVNAVNLTGWNLRNLRQQGRFQGAQIAVGMIRRHAAFVGQNDMPRIKTSILMIRKGLR